MFEVPGGLGNGRAEWNKANSNPMIRVGGRRDRPRGEGRAAGVPQGKSSNGELQRALIRRERNLPKGSKTQGTVTNAPRWASDVVSDTNFRSNGREEADVQTQQRNSTAKKQAGNFDPAEVAARAAAAVGERKAVSSCRLTRASGRVAHEAGIRCDFGPAGSTACFTDARDPSSGRGMPAGETATSISRLGPLLFMSPLRPCGELHPLPAASARRPRAAPRAVAAAGPAQASSPLT